MARKHGSKPTGHKSRARPVNPKDASVARWSKLSDIPLDDEDRFHVSRDHILLNGEDDEYIDEGDQDEVFALKGLAEDSDEDSAGDDEEGDHEESDEDEEVVQEEAPSKKASKAKTKKSKPSPPSSQASESGSEDEEESWGRKKSDYYSSNAAQLESDDEEANELEEEEAKRLQTKTRDSMVEDDFGLGDAVEDLVEPEDDLLEPPPLTVEPLPQDKQSLLRHLEKTSPEALALARDWDDIARSLVKSQAKVAALETADPDGLSLGMVHLHYQALLTYATTLAFYLHLRSSDKYAARPDLLRAHPIMKRLLTLKQSLTTLEELNFAPSDSDSDSDVDEDADAFDLWNLDKAEGFDLDELKDLLADAGEVLTGLDTLTNSKGNQSSSEPEPGLKIKIKKKEGRKPSEVGSGPSNTDEPPPKKKRKTKKSSKSGGDGNSTSATITLPTFDLEEPTFPSSSSKKSGLVSSKNTAAAYDPYGEHLALQQPDAEDKASRKRSLRFHTSKIESSTARREKARLGMGGDDDIPWKERKKVKEERLAREAAKKRGTGGDDLDDVEPEGREEEDAEGGKKRKRDADADEDEDSGGESDGGYYNLVKQHSKAKKEKKKVEYELAQAAVRASLEEESAADGPRSLTRAILKNKGLTPHRSKSVRNPRVKKRQRFEKAKKKVASQKAVYKGGISDTGKYDGEKSGISKVIKSVRL